MKICHAVARLLAAVSLVGCGGGAVSGGAANGGTRDAHTASGSENSSGRTVRHAALAPLRPAGAEAVLAPLERGERGAAAYARAASFYARTDAAGMGLIYGLTCAALSPECAGDERIASLMAGVLRERISMTEQGESRRVSTRLAPGSMPAIQARDGSLSAPVAHLFEVQFVPALVEFHGTWTLEGVVGALANYVSISAQHASPVSANLELDGWLAELAAAGHLDAFVAMVFGPAFGPELASWDASHPRAIDAARTWATANPFEPTQAPLPDDLVRIR